MRYKNQYALQLYVLNSKYRHTYRFFKHKKILNFQKFLSKELLWIFLKYILYDLIKRPTPEVR